MRVNRMSEVDNQPERIILFLLEIYIFLSFFETYLTPFIGNSTRYYLLGVIGVCLFFNGFKIALNFCSATVLIWLILKIISLSWSSMVNRDVSNHLLSQLGMVAFVLVISSRVYSEGFMKRILKALLLNSFLFGILSIIFAGYYIDERFVARQVLTLFGQQNDPNNCCAFLGIGIALGGYSVLCEREHRLFSLIVILTNSYAVVLSGSRGGFLFLIAIALILLLLPDQTRAFSVAQFLRKMILLIVIMTIAVYLLEQFVPSASLERVIAFEEYQGASGRIDKWSIAVELISERPILGWGWGGYIIEGINAVHNTYLTVMCDIGIVGFILFLIPWIYLISNAFRLRSLLTIMLLLCGLFPSISIDSINKRYFWNSLIVALMLIQYYQRSGVIPKIWDTKGGG